MEHSATYSPEDNKLRLYPACRLDSETYNRVKAAGFRWAPKQELFVCPAWSPQAEDLLVEMCGEIGDEDTSLVERAEQRADRFSDYSANRAEDAEQARQAVAAIADNIPLGQPILVGHHSEKHARRDAEKIENGMRRAVKMWEQSNYWKQRAAGAIAAAKYKERPDVRARRIKGLESDIRVYRSRFTPDPKQAPILCQRWDAKADDPKVPHVWCSPRGGRGGSWVPVEDLPAREKHYTRWIEHCERRLVYERAMLEAEGAAHLLEPKPRPKQLPLCNYLAPEGIDIDNPYGYCNRPGEKKLHYPQLSMTQAEYARIHDDYKGTRVVNHSHRVRTAMVKHSLYCIFLTDAKTHTPPPPEEPAPRDWPHRTPAALIAEPEPDPQAAEFEAMRDNLRSGSAVQVVSAPQLFPTPPELAARMVELAEIEPEQRILEPSVGTGNIAKAAFAAAPVRIVAVEVNGRVLEVFTASYRTLGPESNSRIETHCADFLSCNGDLGKFDRVLMNPPFENGTDIKHIRHALEMLKPSGKLVAICANGPRQQEQLRPLADSWEELPEGTFAGTGVRAALLTIRKAPEVTPRLF